MLTIRLNPNPEIKIQQIDDDHRCAVIDDFLEAPDDLVNYACKVADEFELQEIGYPGVLYDIDQVAMSNLQRFLRAHMSKEFSFFKADIRTSSYLSMATRQPHELAPLQRLCHSDPRQQPQRRNYAALVYLFENEELGGTGFYRWKQQNLIEEATALEMERPGGSLEFLQQHFDMYREEPRYMAGSNDVAELLLEVPAKFNRFVFYSGDLPHSAHIPKPDLLSTDFARGRLTLNCFASVRPR